MSDIAARLSRPALAAVIAVLTAACLTVAGCGSGGSGHNSSSQASSASANGTANSAAALLSAGIAQANAKHYQAAETTFRNVLVISPKNKLAWYNLGLLAQIQNQSASALSAYSRALAIDPKYTPAMYNKAILIERKDPHAALALYKQITSINPKAATAYLRESFVYGRLGDKPSAAQARARAIALDKSLSTVRAP